MPGSASEERSVTVAWAVGTEPELSERLIREAIGLGDPIADDLLLIHRCPSCGSGEHGRPHLTVGSDDDPGPFVSISRAGRLTVVAISRLGPVGVDVEIDGAADVPGFDRVALHPGEQSTNSRTVLWVRKESVLKATGHGLRVEPSRLRVTAPSQPPALVEWDGPDAPPTAWMYDVGTSPGHVAAVTVLAPHRPELVVKQARGALVPSTTP